MRRLFLPPDQIAATSGRIVITGEVRRYLDVLRLKSGDPLLILDGTGTVYQTQLEDFSRREVIASIVENWQEVEDNLPIQLLQGLPKGGKIDLVLQKGTELGVNHFIPYSAERSVVALNDYNALDSRKKLERRDRWQKIVTEAARQSERSIIPQVDELQLLSAAISRVTAKRRLMLLERSSIPIATEFASPVESLAILIGPEGGFTQEEVEMATDAGFVPVSLGRRILRTETAGLAVCAIAQHLFGDLGGKSPLNRGSSS